MGGKVFGIGLNKTGTRSVAQAVRLLGFRTLHKGDAATSALVDEARAAGEPLLARIGAGYDAYFDVDAIARNFALLDAQYPGSKFILTTRDADAWIASRRRHVEANRERAARGEYTGTFLEVDEEAWLADREAHHRAVRDHFGDRPDLLVFDVAAGDGWDELAPFLGRPVPRVPFPWENRQGAGSYRPEAAAAALRRRGQAAVGRLRRWIS